MRWFFIMMFAYSNITRVTFILLHPIRIDNDGPERLYIFANAEYHKGNHLYVYIIAWIVFFSCCYIVPVVFVVVRNIYAVWSCC